MYPFFFSHGFLFLVPDKTIQEIEYPFCDTGNMDAEKFQQYRYYLVFVQVGNWILNSIFIFFLKPCPSNDEIASEKTIQRCL